MKRWIIVTTDFVALHKWEEGAYTKTGDYLRYLHRHKFYITIKISVEDDNREIEFHEFKNWMEGILRGPTCPMQKWMSCEMLTVEIAKIIRNIENYRNRDLIIDASEDNENSARLELSKEELI